MPHFPYQHPLRPLTQFPTPTLTLPLLLLLLLSLSLFCPCDAYPEKWLKTNDAFYCGKLVNAAQAAAAAQGGWFHGFERTAERAHLGAGAGGSGGSGGLGFRIPLPAAADDEAVGWFVTATAGTFHGSGNAAESCTEFRWFMGTVWVCLSVCLPACMDEWTNE